MAYSQGETLGLAERALQVQSFITRVYGWMSVGLMTTALVAAYVASNQSMMEAILMNRAIVWGLLGAELLLVFGLSAMINRISAATALGVFLLYSALNGATFSILLLIYTAQSIGLTFAITAGMFGSMCLFGAVTKRDLTSMGSFMFMGLIGLIIASFANFFLHSTMVYWLTTYFGIFIFVGLTAYDAQKVKRIGEQAFMGGEDAMKKASVMGALALYLDFVNMFLYLLRIIGKQRE